METETTADTGLGTAYERWALNKVLQKIQAEQGITSTLEGPGDGMTGIYGINSLILGTLGTSVTLLVSPSSQTSITRQTWEIHAPQTTLKITEYRDEIVLPFPDSQFDLAWNFNIMTCVPEPEGLLSELARISRKLVFICVPNRSNYSFWLHQWHHKVAHTSWNHGNTRLMQPSPWCQLFARLGLHVREIIWLDCPWWPDIVDFGQLLIDFFPFLKGIAKKAKPENRLKWESADLPYYRPDRYPEIHQRMNRLAFIENTHLIWLKKRFAHHVGILAEKQ